MKNMIYGTLVAFTLSLGALYAVPARADVEDSVKETAKETKKDMKKAGRKVQDKTCEMVDGKLNCAAKRAKHKVQNAADDLK